MRISKTKSELQAFIQNEKQKGKTIGLVPTMGALHEGHLSLLKYLRARCDILVCSIFINPTQFNDPEDLKHYPVTLDQDIEGLRTHHCDVLFLPSVDEMYPPGEQEWHIDLGDLETVWEGKHRPGHFQGVTQIVYKLFNLVKPDRACFGQKDFQQIKVIEKLIEIKNLPVTLDICPTQRDENGLALSSRNKFLSPSGEKKAAKIHEALQYIHKHIHTEHLGNLLKKGKEIIEDNTPLETEYLAICDIDTLKPVTQIHSSKKYIIVVAAWLEGIRLIDNLPLKNIKPATPLPVLGK
ncbi:MAG TPA: pantoate--beta-alanine ligase [Sphingobacterium sp.]|nr:pantoate--beta-alanine ligase [Sphingobacterium sp.]